jgi:hypothetical protein
MIRGSIALLALVAASGAAAGPAAGAPARPQTFAAGTSVRSAAFDSLGDTLALGSSASDTAVPFVRSAGGAWRRESSLGGAPAAASLGPTGSAYLFSDGGGSAGPLVVTAGPLAGPWATSTLDAESDGTATYAATDAQGDVTAAWQRGPDVVSSTFDPATGWSAADRVAQGPADLAGLAVDRRGDAVVTWTQEDTGGGTELWADYRPVGSGWAQPARLDARGRVDNSGSGLADVQVAMDDSGRATVVWSYLHASGEVGGIQSVTTSVEGAWPSPTALDTGGAFGSAGSDTGFTDLSMAASGQSTVLVFTANTRKGWFLEVATRQGDGGWVVRALPRTAYRFFPYPPNQGFFAAPAVAINANGDTVVVWRSAPGLVAAYRPAGRAWGRPMYVAAGASSLTRGYFADADYFADFLAAGISETGTATAIWSTIGGDRDRSVDIGPSTVGLPAVRVTLTDLAPSRRSIVRERAIHIRVTTNSTGPLNLSFTTVDHADLRTQMRAHHPRVFSIHISNRVVHQLKRGGVAARFVRVFVAAYGPDRTPTIRWTRLRIR